MQFSATEFFHNICATKYLGAMLYFYLIVLLLRPFKLYIVHETAIKGSPKLRSAFCNARREAKLTTYLLIGIV